MYKLLFHPYPTSQMVRGEQTEQERRQELVQHLIDDLYYGYRCSPDDIVALAIMARDQIREQHGG